MAMPRFFRGAPVASAALNTLAQELDYQSLAVKVRRSAPLIAQSSLTYRLITWQVEDYDTYGGGMWDPTATDYVFIRVDGVYDLHAQIRFSWPNSPPAAYSSGLRGGMIMVNTTDPFATDSRAEPKASALTPSTTIADGATISLSATEILYRGDRVYVNWWHSASASIDALHQDYGGTYLSVARAGPLA